jgi:hypothetical protein
LHWPFLGVRHEVRGAAVAVVKNTLRLAYAISAQKIGEKPPIRRETAGFADFLPFMLQLCRNHHGAMTAQPVFTSYAVVLLSH